MTPWHSGPGSEAYPWRQMSTVFFEPLVTVWWIITPCTGPQGPLWLRLWSRQSPTSTTVRPSAFRAARKRAALIGCAMRPPDMTKPRGRSTPGAYGWVGQAAFHVAVIRMFLPVGMLLNADRRLIWPDDPIVHSPSLLPSPQPVLITTGGRQPTGRVAAARSGQLEPIPPYPAG